MDVSHTKYTYQDIPDYKINLLIFARWNELTRKIEMWVEIQELGECGDYVSVEVTPQKDVLTGGVYQLRQGQQRRIVCRVKPVSNSGTLPLICEVRKINLQACWLESSFTLHIKYR